MHRAAMLLLRFASNRQVISASAHHSASLPPAMPLSDRRVQACSSLFWQLHNDLPVSRSGSSAAFAARSSSAPVPAALLPADLALLLPEFVRSAAAAPAYHISTLARQGHQLIPSSQLSSPRSPRCCSGVLHCVNIGSIPRGRFRHSWQGPPHRARSRSCSSSTNQNAAL